MTGETVTGEAAAVEVPATCPSCGAPVGTGERFCETCGAELPARVGANGTPGADGTPGTPGTDGTPGADGAGAGSGGRPGATAATAAPGAVVPAAPVLPVRDGVVVVDADLGETPTTCAACGGRVAPDGYCEECGTPARRPRDHWVDRPAEWVALVCDRGVRHTRNEDAGAVAATPEPDGYAALVVCDGVSSAVDSDRASLAAARAARDVLAAVPAADPGTGDDARLTALEAAVRDAAAAASREAVAAATEPHGPNPPSCTFVSAVLEGPLLVTGWVGDSRAYWLPDGAPAEQLSVDDSWASEAIAHGMSREEAESGPHAHAITRWLGVDAPDPVPRTLTRRLDRAGWLLVCSDGLWNYCSAPEAVQGLLTGVLDGTVTAAGTAAIDPGRADPSAVAEVLVAWANRQGGQDNITAALARVQPG